VKKRGLRYYRPTGQLDPDPDELAPARHELAQLESQAQQGNIILRYEEATLLWRFALPRAGWWRTANRSRLPTGGLSPRQLKHQEALKRLAWQQHRSWVRIRSGVLLSVVGAVQYGTNRGFWKVVPHFDTYAYRQFVHQLMASFAPAQKAVIMVADRRGIHRAQALQSTWQHYTDRFRLHLFPARAGHHLNPIGGFWRVMKDPIGAG
jgi:hypothetical protein